MFKTGDNGVEDFAINLWNALYPNVNVSLNPVASLERQKFLEMAKILLVQVHKLLDKVVRGDSNNT